MRQDKWRPTCQPQPHQCRCCWREPQHRTMRQPQPHHCRCSWREPQHGPMCQPQPHHCRCWWREPQRIHCTLCHLVEGHLLAGAPADRAAGGRRKGRTEDVAETPGDKARPSRAPKAATRSKAQHLAETQAPTCNIISAQQQTAQTPDTVLNPWQVIGRSA